MRRRKADGLRRRLMPADGANSLTTPNGRNATSGSFQISANPSTVRHQNHNRILNPRAMSFWFSSLFEPLPIPQMTFLARHAFKTVSTAASTSG